jgi:hypothetical protein
MHTQLLKCYARNCSKRTSRTQANPGYVTDLYINLIHVPRLQQVRLYFFQESLRSKELLQNDHMVACDRFEHDSDAVYRMLVLSQV